MKKGSHFPEKSKNKVSEGLKKYFKTHDVWNKGKKFSIYNEPPHTRLRRDPNYYLKELEANAKRRKALGYDTDPERIEQIKKRKEYYEEITGKGRPRKEWTIEEVKWLKENKEKPYLEICRYLGRSWASIGHKMSRLGLQRYNKWTT